MAGAPSKSGGGAVYVVFGSANPGNVSTSSLSAAGLTNDPVNPNTSWPTTLGSRYDGFMLDGHTGMSLTALADLNGDGRQELAVGAPDAALHRPGGGGVAVLYGRPSGVHITLNDLWENGYPYFFHIDFPPLDNQNVGTSVASVGDMTGDGLPDLALGAPHADYNGKADSGSVWIINGHLPPIVGCTQASPAGTCPWIKLNALAPSEGYRIDGAAPGDQLGSSLAGVGDQNGDGIRDLAIGAAGASPAGRTGAGEVVVVAGQAGSATRDLSTSAPLQTIIGAQAGAGLGASLAAAGDAGGDGHVDMLIGAPGESSFAGAVYLVIGAAGTSSDLAQTAAKITPAGAGAMSGSSIAAGNRARRRRCRLADRRAGRGRKRRLVPGRRQRHARPAATARHAHAARPASPAAHASADAAGTAGRASREHHDDGHHAVGQRDHDHHDADGHQDHHHDDPERRHHHEDDSGQEGRQEKEEEAPALPGQEAQAEVPRRQRQAREDQAEALPPAPEGQGEGEGQGQDDGQGQGDGEGLVPIGHPDVSAECPA